MKLINVDMGCGREISPDDEAKLEQGIYDGVVSIDLGEARDFQGDICLSDDDYCAAVEVLSKKPKLKTAAALRAQDMEGRLDNRTIPI